MLLKSSVVIVLISILVPINSLIVSACSSSVSHPADFLWGCKVFCVYTQFDSVFAGLFSRPYTVYWIDPILFFSNIYASGHPNPHYYPNKTKSTYAVAQFKNICYPFILHITGFKINLYMRIVKINMKL